MKELKCPKCGSTITVDEADYALLLGQVKTAEFNAEVERRMVELHKQHDAEQKAATMRAEHEAQRRLSAKDTEIAKMQTKLAEMQGRIDGADSRVRAAVLEERERQTKAMEEKTREIAEAKMALQAERANAMQQQNALRDKYELQLKQKQEMVDYYKNFKTSLSTKMIGESLEVHCSDEFNSRRAISFPMAYFEKDNDLTKGGTKGDFILRDYATEEDRKAGREYISIMFEMKNEADGTASKHRNEDFFAKLDKDRNDKGCEYAVLVSMLEPDSELYNQGIVDVSYRYPKMFVVRPQCFMTIISLLAQTSMKTVHLQRALVEAQQTSIDISNFEQKIGTFRDKFVKHYEQATDKFNKAIEDIDKTIKHLQRVKEDLQGTQSCLRKANDDTEALTIRRLTHGNPTVRKMIEEARQPD